MSLHELNWHHGTTRRLLIVAFVIAAILLLAANARAQDHVHAPDPTSPHAKSAEELNSEFHMEMTPLRKATAADSARAASVVTTLRQALAQYRDTTAAVADGYKMFMPEMKNQKTYHFTNNWRAVQEAFRFDASKPTSLLYKKDSAGKFVLIGAMYTAPKRWGPDKLDARVPLSIAHWHKHVNWCLPKKGENQRWLERKDGEAVFGPASPIATKAACNAVDGNFEESIFGWKIHANVFAGDDPATIWGDDHMTKDMHAGMKMDDL